MKTKATTGVIFLSLLLFSIQQAKTQSFSIDPDFNPFFDITGPSALGGGTVGPIVEDPNNGKLMLGGDFKLVIGSERYKGIIRINKDGSRDTAFNKGGGRNAGVVRIQRINDSTWFHGNNGSYALIDSVHKVDVNWLTTIRGTVSCSRAEQPYFFPNGAALMSKYTGNLGGCRIFQPPDTFAHRYIIKVDSLGYWDSSFTKDANQPPAGFQKYDSSRIWVYGNPAVLSHYDSTQVNGLFRIYQDGTLDTTFKSPFNASVDVRTLRISFTEENGGFFLYGYFTLPQDTADYLSLVRFHADGSIDSSFNNYGQNYSIFFQGEGGVATIAPTEDGGYLIGGGFDSIQGVAKHNIAKLDSNGNLESQYFTTLGPDSSYYYTGEPAFVSHIVPSKFGGYYVSGDFLKWDGQLVQPIVRLKGLVVGEEEIGKGEMQKWKVETYPNPTSENLHLRIEQPNVIRKIQLFDLLGKEQSIFIDQKDHWNYTLNLNGLPKGIYILSLQAKDGSTVSKKVVKN